MIDHHPDYPEGYLTGVGPAAPPASRCFCGLPAACACQGCGALLCRHHWGRHSHTSRSPHMSPGPALAR